MLFGVYGQFISAVMGFLVRTVFIYTLGVEYLGVEGLFTSILMMLSLANLGFDSAMTYSLYKPLADNDITKIQALMNLYKKAYRVIGIVVLIIGLAILPFLSFLINGTTTVENLYLIYILFLISSVSSYFFVYKQTLIIADQQMHIISKIHSFLIFISNVLQIILLITTKNYLLVLLAQLLLRVFENVYIARVCNMKYPYIKLNKNIELTSQDKKDFYNKLYALFLYRISGVIINGTDNIVISKFVGIVWVGIYSNYFLIISTLNSFLSHIFYSITASVGNLNIKENPEKKYFIFQVINLANFWIYGLLTVIMWNVLNPFIIIWLGDEYLLNKFIIFSILLNFYTAGMQNTTTTFRDSSGLFEKGKYRPILAGLINIITSIFLAEKIGIAGVFIGTVISRLFTFFWYDPYIIFKFIFETPVRIYFIRYINYLVLIGISILVTDKLNNLLLVEPVYEIFLRLIISMLITNVIFLFYFRKSKELKYIMNIFKGIYFKLPLKRIGAFDESK